MRGLHLFPPPEDRYPGGRVGPSFRRERLINTVVLARHFNQTLSEIRALKLWELDALTERRDQELKAQSGEG
jgi:hypothetical protein